MPEPIEVATIATCAVVGFLNVHPSASLQISETRYGLFVLFAWLCRFVYLRWFWKLHGRELSPMVDSLSPPVFLGHAIGAALSIPVVSVENRTLLFSLEWLPCLVHGICVSFFVAWSQTSRHKRIARRPWTRIVAYIGTTIVIGFIWNESPHIRIGVSRMYDERDPATSLVATFLGCALGIGLAKLGVFVEACATVVKIVKED